MTFLPILCHPSVRFILLMHLKLNCRHLYTSSKHSSTHVIKRIHRWDLTPGPHRPAVLPHRGAKLRPPPVRLCPWTPCQASALTILPRVLLAQPGTFLSQSGEAGLVPVPPYGPPEALLRTEPRRLPVTFKISTSFLEMEWAENCWVSWERKASRACRRPCSCLRHRQQCS